MIDRTSGCLHDEVIARLFVGRDDLPSFFIGLKFFGRLNVTSDEWKLKFFSTHAMSNPAFGWEYYLFY